MVGIAESGAGKNHSRMVLNELFRRAGLLQYLGGNKIASGAGLSAAIQRQPASLFQLDEFGMFLSAAADRKRSPRYICEIPDQQPIKLTDHTQLYEKLCVCPTQSRRCASLGSYPRRTLARQHDRALCLSPKKTRAGARRGGWSDEFWRVRGLARSRLRAKREGVVNA